MIKPAVTALAFFATPAVADGFAPVKDRSVFVSLIEGRDLKRLGITLRVTGDGQINGRALGQKVRGAWRWTGGYFCRDLYWGNQDLGPNCQAVKVNGQTLRFISDKGAGEFADLTLD